MLLTILEGGGARMFCNFCVEKIPTHTFRDSLDPPGGYLCCCVACIVDPTKRIQHNGNFLMAPFIATSERLCLPDPHNRSGTSFHKAYWSLGTDAYLHIHSTPDVVIFIRLRNTANESTHRPLYHSWSTADLKTWQESLGSTRWTVSVS